MTFINLTPHRINEVTTGKVFDPSGIIARVECEYEIDMEIDDIPMYVARFGEVEGLPKPQKDTMYIVSGLVLDASNRKDLVAPGSLVRGEDGQPIGCQGFRTKA